MPQNVLKEKYNYKDGKLLGDKLKQLETAWLSNNFKLADEKVDSILIYIVLFGFVSKLITKKSITSSYILYNPFFYQLADNHPHPL